MHIYAIFKIDAPYVTVQAPYVIIWLYGNRKRTLHIISFCLCLVKHAHVAHQSRSLIGVRLHIYCTNVHALLDKDTRDLHAAFLSLFLFQYRFSSSHTRSIFTICVLIIRANRTTNRRNKIGGTRNMLATAVAFATFSFRLEFPLFRRRILRYEFEQEIRRTRGDEK